MAKAGVVRTEADDGRRHTERTTSPAAGRRHCASGVPDSAAEWRLAVRRGI